MSLHPTKLLSLLLCFALFTSCASSGEETSSSPDSSDSAEQTSQPAQQSQPTQTENAAASTNLSSTAHASCSADAVTQAVPSEFEGYKFDRYYELKIDGKRAMRYLLQSDLTQAQIEHVVRTTRWYLTNVPDAKYGADKAAVLATLEKNGSLMVVPNGTHVEGQDLGVQGQELYFNEIAAPGSAWYINNDPEHRDATLEEVFHQVHDAGIGTNRPGALPEYQKALLAEAEIASKDGRWATGEDAWIKDLTQEGSLAQEYIASVLDNYFGMWAHDSSGSGYYAYNNRADVIAKDPNGAMLLRQFLGDVVEVEAYIDPAFTGTFYFTKHPEAAYSNKSQYLRGARLTGTNASSLVGNDLDNTLRGNSADNTLDGGAGNDTVIYCSNASEYTVTSDSSDGTTKVTVSGPDGTDTLLNIEQIHFADEIKPADSASE